MDTEKIRNLVKKHLSEKPRNTVEIKHWLSENIDLKDNYDLAAILESDPSIIRIGRVRARATKDRGVGFAAARRGGERRGHERSGDRTTRRGFDD